MKTNSRIIIIEDDIDMVESMKKILETQDYEVTYAYDPDEVGERIIKEEIDLILLDVMFGAKAESKGFVFAREIRMNKQTSGIPILMLTSINKAFPHFNFSDATDEEFLPVDGFIDKPAEPNEILSIVKELLTKKTSKWINWPEKE